MLVDGVTKLDKVKYGDTAQAETIRKMIVAMSRDIRVLVIKLADRLHNMRTLRYLKQETQERIARETLDIYAPLAHRLGMNTLKWELEDLAFATLHPKMYDEIVRLVAERAPSRDQFLAQVIDQVESDLRDAKIKAMVTGRPKHYYSIYQKMIVRGRDFSDIYDLVGIRILVEDDRDCYAVLGVLHSRWNPVPGPVQGLRGDAEVQHVPVAAHDGDRARRASPSSCRSAPSRCTAARSTASPRTGSTRRTCAPATTPSRTPRPDGSADMAWVRQLLDWQQETEDPGEFLESLRFEINSAEVYVFTPRGDVIALPTGSTPVDFAYAIHTEVGHHTIGARVNGRLVPLESKLDNGDVVEVFTSKAPNAGPSRDWLGFVKSPRARNKIRQWFTKERREEAIEQGKDQIARLMRKEGQPLKRLLTHETLTHGRRRAAAGRRLRALRRGRRGQHRCADRRTPGDRPVRRRGGRGRGPGRGRHDHPATATWPGCASCSTGSTRPRTRGSSSSRCGSRSTPSEVYVFTPRGDVHRAADRVVAGRLRLRDPHRGRAPHDRCPGQRPAGPAGVQARQRRRRRGVHLEGAERRAEPRLAGLRRSHRGPATRSGSGSPRSAARRPSSRARTRSPG